VLAFELHAVELEIELELAAAGRSREAGKELFLVCDAHAIRVEQEVSIPGFSWIHSTSFEELRMQRRSPPESCRISIPPLRSTTP